MSILEEIFAHKRLEVSERKRSIPESELRSQALGSPPPVDFLKAIQQKRSAPALIAEVKLRSPSRGSFNCTYDPLRLAGLYASNGAAAISVLTDQRYFGGNLADLRRIASQDHCLPLLRKDFIFDPYQVYEARAAGADAILLIAAALHRRLLQELHDLSLQYGLMPLIEVHNRRELDLALNCRPRLIGINNRNLADFSISLNTFLNLRPLVPEGILVVAESGIHSSEDVRLLARAGANAILVGEGLVTAGEIGRKVREIAGLEV